MRPLREKLIVFCLGTIAVLLFLEIILRITGGIYQSSGPNCLSANINKKNTYTILCLGNSHTYGIGAPKGHSYPDYLQKILTEKIAGKTFNVINKGKNNMNSWELLNELDIYIQQISPDLVILRTGSPNIRNRYGYREYLARKKINSNKNMNLKFVLEEKLSRLRICRLFLILCNELKQKLQKNYPFPSHSVRDELDCSKYGNEVVQTVLQIFYTKSYNEEVSLKKGKIKKIKTLLAAQKLQTNEDYYWYYFCLGNIYDYEGETIKAVEAFFRGMKNGPSHRSRNLNYFCLLNIAKKNKDIIKTMNYNVKDFKKVMTDLYFQDDLRLFQEEELVNWVKLDLQEMIQTIRSRKVSLIIQNYPVLNENDIYMKTINQTLKAVAERFNIVFVDNEAIFKDIWDEHHNKEQYIESYYGFKGSHVNAKGYELTAENIFKVIQSENIITNR